MSITKILERQQALAAATSKALDFKGVTADQLRLPLVRQERRIEELKQRIDGLERARKAYNQRVDEEVKALGTEIGGAKARLERDSKSFAPVLEQRPTPGPTRGASPITPQTAPRGTRTKKS